VTHPDPPQIGHQHRWERVGAHGRRGFSAWTGGDGWRPGCGILTLGSWTTSGVDAAAHETNIRTAQQQTDYVLRPVRAVGNRKKIQNASVGAAFVAETVITRDAANSGSRAA
jgi:hypothetical protein